MAPDPDKLTVVREWPTPETVKQVQSFLGFAGYYCWFIRCFSQIAKPLNGLLVGRGRSKRQNLQNIEWTLECEAAFQQLKKELVQAPTLDYADFSLPFLVYTDASNQGLGAVLALQHLHYNTSTCHVLRWHDRSEILKGAPGGGGNEVGHH